MAEPATTISVTVASCAATSSVVVPILCAIGLQPVSVGAGLLGCVAMQLIHPAEQVRFWRIATLTAGSVIFASMAAPWGVPLVWKSGIVPAGMTLEQIHIAVAGVLGAMAKPMMAFMAARMKAAQERLFGRATDA